MATKRLLSVLLLGFVGLGCVMARSLSNELDNNISSGGSSGTDSAESSSSSASSSYGNAKQVDWVRISQSPGEVLRKPAGSRFELECEAVGSPAPTLQWLKGGQPLTENESYETNMINDKEAHGLAKVRARLVVHAPLHEGHEGVFTCVAESGTHVATANTQLYVTHSVMSGRNFSQLLAENLLSGRSPPRIVLYDTVYMDNIGEDIVLPCTVVGSPQPIVFWLDPSEQVIEHDPRLTVLPDGGLRIRNIRWNDMGPYTCVARNSHGQDNITTFLYPMLAEK